MIKVVFALLISFLVVHAHELAVIEKIEGKVKVLGANAIKSKKAKVNQVLCQGDLLLTYQNSQVSFKLKDGSVIVVAQNSKLRLSDAQTMKQESGKAFYNIKTQSNNQFKVGTSFATIGVKGTKFIVQESKDSQWVSLKKGLIGLASLDKPFEIHRKKGKPLSEFEKYTLAHKYEYEEYKKELYEEFVEYKKMFDLYPNKTVTFNKNVVKEDIITKNIQDEFRKLENF